MQCRVCGADVEQTAASCPRCGAEVDDADGSATAELPTASAERTEELRPDSSRPAPGQTTAAGREPVLQAPTSSKLPAPAAVASDFWLALRRMLTSGGWVDAAGAAALAFVAILCVGAVLGLALKLQGATVDAAPGLAGALAATVILGLALLRVPVELGDLQVSVMPLGAFAAAGGAIAWSSAAIVRNRDAVDLRAAAVDGAKVGVPLGLLCLVAAAVFKLTRGRSVIAAGAAAALLYGGLWGTLFGGVGGAAAHRRLREVVLERWHRGRAESPQLAAGVAGGAAMVGCAGLLAALAGLLWTIVALASGRIGSGLSAADAVAALIYVVAFAPNLLIMIIGLALGAPIAAGSAVTIGGRVVGSLQEYSLFDWAGRGAPWYAWLLLLIPILSCLLGGFVARRVAGAGAEPIKSLAVATGAFVAVLFVGSVLGEARLGADLAGSRGFGLLVVRPLPLAFFGALWGGAAGAAGWWLAQAYGRDAA